MAVALSWKGYVDTDLKFSEFVAGDDTIMLRFMPQFPNAYEAGHGVSLQSPSVTVDAIERPSPN